MIIKEAIAGSGKFVNNKKIAEGEVVVIDKHFGIRITNLLETSERLQGLKA